MTTLTDHPRRYCPACDHVVRRDFLPGPGQRPDAACPRCRSLERHRFLALLLALLRPGLGEVDILLEISPSPHSTRHLARLSPRAHVGLDIGYDGRLVDVLGSLTHLPCADDSVDLLVCYHVLEHIPDDRERDARAGAGAVPRRPGLVQVPWRPGTATDEDPDADDDERLRRFGQRDHVRYYGDDFEDRMRAAGLVLDRVTPREVLGEAMVTWCKLAAQEPVWLVRVGVGASAVAEPAGESAGENALSTALEAILGELVQSRADLSVARARVRRLRGRRDALRAQVEQLESAVSGPGAAPLTQRVPPSVARAARGVRRRVRALAGRG